MATTTWDSFYPYIQPFLPGCPEIVMESHLQESASKFLERSGVWRFEIENDFAVRNVAEYPIFIPSNEAILENVYEIVIDGRQLTRVTDRHLDSTKFETNGAPSYYTIYQDTSIRFYPTPDRKYTFRGWGSLKTKLTATGVEDWIFESHGRCISYGAISLLASVPGKEWSNPDLAMYYKQLFAKEADEAKAREYRHVNMRVRSQNFEGRRWRA